MRKTKVNKRKIKHSKKTRKVGSYDKRDLKADGKGITDEVLKFRGYIKELQNTRLTKKH
jgi:hypothetical protein